MDTPTTYISGSKPSHHSRSSIYSLYDLLADLDETQLQYLVQEMNNTTTQNMAVGQAVSAWETDNPSSSLRAARANMQPPTMQRTLSKTQKIRLSLQTMFRASSTRQQKPSVDEFSTPKRGSPAYKRISRPVFNLPPEVTVADLQALLQAEFLCVPRSPLSIRSASTSSSPSPTTSSSGRMRRYASTIDMALEAERSAIGAEGLGLAMLEPRPTTPCTPCAYSPATPVFDQRTRGETPPPIVLDGIFEVLENR
ncbi:hypothetical protein H2198_001690 [Neophaeococcomyces mojaviensis]|uniref:Uncharacterized protein n=1 Tax=Neophaeococcomyces mojaviensis TaxID=3383035 RepID=A0ACC3AGY2_9EURO|nr:hypothetical protein H2198_001690 [Knufia sp. JES_112]